MTSPLLDRAKTLPPLTVAVAGAASDLVAESIRQAEAHRLITAIPIDGADEDDIARRTAQCAASGEAAAIMKGTIHTDTLMRALLNRDNGLRTDTRASHGFLMTWPENTTGLVITDAALNVAPDADMLVHIARNGIAMARAAGITQPQVAMLSAGETMPSSITAGKAADVLSRDGLSAQGPLALDGALSPHAAKLKNISGPVAGHANVLVVPNIETGNALFKMMVWGMNATPAGVVSGLKVPVALTSRADSPTARLASCALMKLMGERA